METALWLLVVLRLCCFRQFSPAAPFHLDNQGYTCWREAHTPFLTSHSREVALSPSSSIVLLRLPLICLSGMGGKYQPTDSATHYTYPLSHKFHHRTTSACCLILTLSVFGFNSVSSYWYLVHLIYHCFQLAHKQTSHWQVLLSGRTMASA